jgi:hypothetical protein
MKKILWICGNQFSGKTTLAFDIYEGIDDFACLNDNGLNIEAAVAEISGWSNSGIMITQVKPTKEQLKPLSDCGFTIQVIEALYFL